MNIFFVKQKKANFTGDMTRENEYIFVKVTY